MSGIISVYQRHKQVSPALLERMAAKISHRGPDRAQVWAANSAGLASFLLKNTPESEHEKPITVSACGTFRMVWDGRLDNRAELIAHFGSSLNDAPDSTLVLKAWEKWGEECPAKLLGDFAFVIWDETAQVLFAARDRMGIKPLHYCWDGANFAAASEAKPLFDFLGAAPKPNKRMIMAFLSFCNFTQEEHHETFFEDIRRLPAGHKLTIRNGSLSVSRYWSANPERVNRKKDEREYAEEFLHIFGEAVKARTRSAAPSGSLLSGGLDSSAVTLLAAKEDKGLAALHAYSHDAAADERSFARAVAAKAGIPVYELFSHSADPLALGLDRLIHEVEGPMVATTQNREIFEFAKARGMKAVLSGEGGDHVLDELGFPSDLLSRGRFGEFFGKVPGFAAQFDAGMKPFMREALVNTLPFTLTKWRRQILRNVPPQWLNRKTVEETGVEARFLAPSENPFTSFSQAVTHASVSSPYSLMKWELEERIWGLYGIEIRFPMLDSRVYEFILSLPWEYRAKGVRKGVLKEALAAELPENVMNRKGKGDWTREMDEALLRICRQPVPEPLADRSGLMEQFIDRRGVKELIDRYMRGHYDLRSSVWFLVTVDHWLNEFITKGTDRERKEEEKLQHA